MARGVIRRSVVLPMPDTAITWAMASIPNFSIRSNTSSPSGRKNGCVLTLLICASSSYSSLVNNP